MRGNFSGLLRLMESLRLLYENDPKVEDAKTDVKAEAKVIASLAAKFPKFRKTKKKKSTGYAASGDDDEDTEWLEEESGGKSESREYSSVFVSRTGAYIVESGYETAKRQQSYRKNEGNRPELAASSDSVKPTESGAASQTKVSYGQYLTELAEAKSMINEMLGAVNADSKYVRELEQTTHLGAGNFRYAHDLSMVKVEFNEPVFINNQWTYQRIFIRNEKEGSNVYGSTMEKAKAGSLEAGVRHDHRFNTVYFDSMNGVRDGDGKAYWEAWVNGEIVEEALDQAKVKKGDVIEWRLANERESGCGGGGVDESLVRPEFRSNYKNPLNIGLAGFGYPPAFGGFGGIGYGQISHSYGLNAFA